MRIAGIPGVSASRLCSRFSTARSLLEWSVHTTVIPLGRRLDGVVMPNFAGQIKLGSGVDRIIQKTSARPAHRPPRATTSHPSARDEQMPDSQFAFDAAE